jgi:hypothetical protein
VLPQAAESAHITRRNTRVVQSQFKLLNQERSVSGARRTSSRIKPASSAASDRRTTLADVITRIVSNLNTQIDDLSLGPSSQSGTKNVA